MRLEITCALTDEGHLEARYAAGQLSNEEAEAFEEHFFACDRCWTMVQRAVEIRAAEARAAPVQRKPARWNSGPPRWLAIAATVTFVAVGIWQVDAWRRPESRPVAMRGQTDSLRVVTETRGAVLVARWARATDASSYRARLYDAKGTVLHQRELADTIITVAAGSLPRTEPGVVVYWEIQAMNRTRQVVARSGLRAVRFPKRGG